MPLDNQVEEKKPLLTREQLRHELNARGYVMSASYFHKICLPSRNAGPPVAKHWGKRPLYNLEDGLAWAEGRCTTASASTGT
jgi:hypothetical protein